MSEALYQAVAALGLMPERDISLAKLGYWRIGGPADVFVELPTVAALCAVQALGVPVTVIGNGSNLLVSDAGIRGLTVRLTGELRSLELGDGLAVAGGGLPNAVLLRRLDQAGRCGLACLAGVPGTVGGAIRLNAGTSLGEIGARTRQVELVFPGGNTALLSASALEFSYRHAAVPKGAVISRVWLEVDGEGVEAERERVATHLTRRKATQPLDMPSCGSVFKNPPGDAAGRLIESVGLKGRVEGGAQISTRHANFIVNTGGATAANVLTLIELAQRTVYEETGIMLEPEVHLVGDIA